MSNNLPDLKRDGIFSKVKKWFKGLFGIGKIEDTLMQEPINENLKKTERNTFKENIKIESKDIVLAMKKKLEKNEIRIDDLSNSELDEMISSYKEEISAKEKKIKYLKEKNGIDSK